MKIPKGYRRLKIGETTQRGDLILYKDKTWGSYAGYKILKGNSPHIRKLSPVSGASEASPARMTASASFSEPARSVGAERMNSGTDTAASDARIQSQAESAASSQTCYFCGEPATKLVKRIITNRVWTACDACCERRRMSRGPYIVTALPNEKGQP